MLWFKKGRFVKWNQIKNVKIIQKINLWFSFDDIKKFAVPQFFSSITLYSSWMLLKDIVKPAKGVYFARFWSILLKRCIDNQTNFIFYRPAWMDGGRAARCHNTEQMRAQQRTALRRRLRTEKSNAMRYSAIVSQFQFSLAQLSPESWRNKWTYHGVST